LLILKTEFKAKKLLPRNRGMQISSRLHSRRVLTVLFSFIFCIFSTFELCNIYIQKIELKTRQTRLKLKNNERDLRNLPSFSL
jgi:hypothetical protein